MKKILICLVASLVVLPALEAPLCAQQLPVWGDLGNGRFRNPVIASDYSDPDVIRVRGMADGQQGGGFAISTGVRILARQVS